MKYTETWKAIDEALAKSVGWNEMEHLDQRTDNVVTVYETIKSCVTYMRKYPTDSEIIDWNLVVCAGAEMLHDPKAPVWNGVIQVWQDERRRIAEEKSA